MVSIVLLWLSMLPGCRHDDPKAKSPREETGTAPESLPAQDARAVILRSLAAFQACYDDGARLDPTLEGMVVVRFVVLPDGRVGETEVVRGEDQGVSEPARSKVTTLPDSTVIKCVVDTYRGLAFPRSRKGAIIQFPLFFRGDDGSP